MYRAGGSYWALTLGELMLLLTLSLKISCAKMHDFVCFGDQSKINPEMVIHLVRLACCKLTATVITIYSIKFRLSN